jgi:hypothetical protein
LEPCEALNRFPHLVCDNPLAVAKAPANIGWKNAASRCHGGEKGTHHRYLKSKKVATFETTAEKKAFDVRLTTGTTYSIFTHGPIEIFVDCGTDAVTVSAMVTNDSTEDTMGTFGAKTPFDKGEEKIKNTIKLGSSETYILYYMLMSKETALIWMVQALLRDIMSDLMVKLQLPSGAMIPTTLLLMETRMSTVSSWESSIHSLTNLEQ